MPGLLVRADASPSAGLGHAMRCLALAQAWRDAGGAVAFRLSGRIQGLDDRIRAEGMRVLDPAGAVEEAVDARESAETARALQAGWVVLDGYGFGRTHQRAIGESGARLLCVDDNAHLDGYSADLIVNQNAYATRAMYAGSAPASTLLLGAEYALLRREFASPPIAPRRVSRRARRVLVTMGGSDPAGLSAFFLRTLGLIGRDTPLEVVVVVGPGDPRAAEIAEAASGLSDCRVIESPDTMRPIMEWAELAISAAGSTLWEMCYVGLPAAVVSVAENQRAAERIVIDEGIATGLGDPGHLTESGAGRIVADLLGDQERRQRQADAGQRLVDGLGARRVVETMMRLQTGGPPCRRR